MKKQKVKTYSTYTVSELEADRDIVSKKILEILNDFERKYSRDLVSNTLTFARYDGFTYGSGPIYTLKVEIEI